jgi:subtilisin
VPRPIKNAPAPPPWGRYLITYSSERADAAVKSLHSFLGSAFHVEDAYDGPTRFGLDAFSRPALVFSPLRAAVLLLPSEAVDKLRDEVSTDGLFLTAELVGPFFTPRAARGKDPGADGKWAEDDESAWGLKAIALSKASGTGEGVNVAIVDSGVGPCDNIPPERIVAAKSFAPDYPSTRDQSGHGTACAGIACGDRTSTGKRFGVASKAGIVNVKVADPIGSCKPETLLKGLCWAMQQGCRVASVSLSMDRRFNADASFANIAKAALEKDMLIVAAAGNDRPLTVVSPASAKHILAVAAFDNNGEVYRDSCPGGKQAGEEVNLAAPGVDVFIITPKKAQYESMYKSGTSLAAPHVAGVAALLLADGTKTADVEKHLTPYAPGLKVNPNDVGKGFLKAPGQPPPPT